MHFDSPWMELMLSLRSEIVILTVLDEIESESKVFEDWNGHFECLEVKLALEY